MSVEARIVLKRLGGQWQQNSPYSLSGKPATYQLKVHKIHNCIDVTSAISLLDRM